MFKLQILHINAFFQNETSITNSWVNRVNRVERKILNRN